MPIFLLLATISIGTCSVLAAEWSLWSEWSLCTTEQAGLASQTRTRTCLGAADCPGGMSSEARQCLETGLPETIAIAPTAEWSMWSEWSECVYSEPGSTDPAFRTRWRDCDRSRCPSAVAMPNSECPLCVGMSYEQEACPPYSPTFKSPSTPIYDARPTIDMPPPSQGCEWSQWSEWSGCNANCGRNARRYRARSCSCYLNPTIAARCPDGPPIEDEVCKGLPPCSSSVLSSPYYPYYLHEDVGAMGRSSALNSSYPCSQCPPMYPLPCYTCINLPPPQPLEVPI